MIAMIEGAAARAEARRSARPSRPYRPGDRRARRRPRWSAHIAAIAKSAAGCISRGQRAGSGTFVGPHIFELDRPAISRTRCSGRSCMSCAGRPATLDALLDALAATGYGLTLGVHTPHRRDDRAVLARAAAGNIYVNRNMIGAVVGTQPFGGVGLSGTGPKAGGPNYLKRFASEQVVAVNTAAAGGNASLIAMGEE